MKKALIHLNNDLIEQVTEQICSKFESLKKIIQDTKAVKDNHINLRRKMKDEFDQLKDFINSQLKQENLAKMEAKMDYLGDSFNK